MDPVPDNSRVRARLYLWRLKKWQIILLLFSQGMIGNNSFLIISAHSNFNAVYERGIKERFINEGFFKCST